MQSNQDDVHDSTLLKWLGIARQEFAKHIQLQFSDYANQTYFWEDPQQIKSIQIQDPESVRIAKHCYFALQDAEYLVQLVLSNRSQYYVVKKIKSVFTILQAARRIHASFIVHLDALYEVIKTAKPEEVLVQQFYFFKEFMFDLMQGHLSQEQKRLLIQRKLVRLGNFIQEIFNIYTHKINGRKGYFFDKEEIVFEEKVIPPEKKAENAYLLNTSKSVIQKIELLTQQLDKILRTTRLQEKQLLTLYSKNFVHEINEALRQSRYDEAGYVRYAENDIVFVKGLKAIFNIMNAIHILSRDIRDRSTLSSALIAVTQLSQAYNHYKMIDRKGMSNERADFIEQLIRAVMIFCRDVLTPGLTKLADDLYEVEMQHHLRYGVLANAWLQQIFYPIEKIYIEKNIFFANPFFYNETREQNLTIALTAADYERKKLREQLQLISQTLRLLQHYLCQDSYYYRDLLLNFFQLRYKNLLDEETARLSYRLEDELISTLSRNSKLQLMHEFNVRRRSSLANKVMAAIKQDDYVLAEWQASSAWIKLNKYLYSSAEWLLSFHPSTIYSSLMGKIKNLQTATMQAFHAADIRHQSYLAACNTLGVFRKEFPLRYFEKNGINHLLGDFAGVERESQAKKNLLRVLLADMALVKRSQFVLERNYLLQVKTQIESLFVTDGREKFLSQQLALEITLGGFVEVTAWKHFSIFLTCPKNKLINVLARLSGKQFVEMIKNISNKHQPSYCRFNLLIMLLNNEVLTESQFCSEVLIKSVDQASDLFTLIMTLMQAFHKSYELAKDDQDQMHKFGLCIGRIAHADRDFAKAFFADAKTKRILFTECLIKQNTFVDNRYQRALYADAFVTTLNIKFENGEGYLSYLRNNLSVISGIHSIVANNMNDVADDFLLDKYQAFENLCDLLHIFIYYFLSRDGYAEKKMCDFFVKLALCSDMNGRAIRNQILLDFSKQYLRDDIACVKWVEASQFASAFWDTLIVDEKTKADTFINDIESCRTIVPSDLYIMLDQERIRIKTAICNLTSTSPAKQKCYFLFQEKNIAIDNIDKILGRYLENMAQQFASYLRHELLEFIEHICVSFFEAKNFIGTKSGMVFVCKKLMEIKQSLDNKVAEEEQNLLGVIGSLDNYVQKHNGFWSELLKPKNQNQLMQQQTLLVKQALTMLRKIVKTKPINCKAAYDVFYNLSSENMILLEKMELNPELAELEFILSTVIGLSHRPQAGPMVNINCSQS